MEASLISSQTAGGRIRALAFAAWNNTNGPVK